MKRIIESAKARLEIAADEALQTKLNGLRKDLTKINDEIKKADKDGKKSLKNKQFNIRRQIEQLMKQKSDAKHAKK